jgi:8-oxo-dGTP pyrophosphatase MutT (NUDIX family)
VNAEFCHMQLTTAGLLHIKERKLLLAFSRNKSCFYLPGGKIDTNETPAGALCREIEEELQLQLYESDLEYYTHITAPAYGEEAGVMMEQDCFLVKRNVDPSAAAEISEIRYFSLDDYLAQTNKAPGAIMILKQLKADGLID